MEYEGYVMALWDLGYRNQPGPKVAEMDAEAIKNQRCGYCGELMRYQGFVNPTGLPGYRYIALAVCRECDYCEEF